MRLVILIGVLFIFSASNCKKEGENCHRAYYVRNNSDSAVILALNSLYIGKCNLYQKALIEPGQQDEIGIRTCWEDNLSNGTSFYIVHPSGLNDTSKFYECDSIEYKNKILKKYELTLADLRKADFIINYP